MNKIIILLMMVIGIVGLSSSVFGAGGNPNNITNPNSGTTTYYNTPLLNFSGGCDGTGINYFLSVIDTNMSITNHTIYWDFVNQIWLNTTYYDNNFNKTINITCTNLVWIINNTAPPFPDFVYGINYQVYLAKTSDFINWTRYDTKGVANFVINYSSTPNIINLIYPLDLINEIPLQSNGTYSNTPDDITFYLRDLNGSRSTDYFNGVTWSGDKVDLEPTFNNSIWEYDWAYITIDFEENVNYSIELEWLNSSDDVLNSSMTYFMYTLLCTPNLINESVTNWNNEGCVTEMMNQSRYILEYDNNSCGGGNTTYYEYRLVNAFVNSSWSSWEENGCDGTEMELISSMNESDNYGCGALTIHYDWLYVNNWINESDNWMDVGGCINHNQYEENNFTQYDGYGCGINTSFTENQTVPCGLLSTNEGFYSKLAYIILIVGLFAVISFFIWKKYNN
jgi:hypothetical protein